MALDTNQLYEQLNKSISVGIEDLLLNRLNKIFSIDNDIELAKVFIGDMLSLYQEFASISKESSKDSSFAPIIKLLIKLNEIINRYSDIVGDSNNTEVKEVKWFINATQLSLEGFEKISNSLNENDIIKCLNLFYEGTDIIVEVIEWSNVADLKFYLNTDIGNVIRCFLQNSDIILNNQVNKFEEHQYNNQDCYLLYKYINRASSSAREIFSQNERLDVVRESAIRELYPDEESYKYMETQGQLFDVSLPKLSQKYKGMYVHFEDGKVLDYDEDEEVLIDRVLENNNYQDVFIEKVS